MCDLLPVSWFRSGTICCRCLGLEVVPQHYDVRFVAGVLVSKWCPSTKMHELLPVSWSRSRAPAQKCVSKWWPITKMNDLSPVSWSRSGAPALRCTICCRCLGLEVVPQHSDVRFVVGVLVSKWCPSTKMYVLLPVSWSRSGAPALKCTFCCRRLGVEVVPQH